MLSTSTRSILPQLSRQSRIFTRSASSAFAPGSFSSPTINNLRATANTQLRNLGLAPSGWKKLGGAAAGAVLLGSAVGQHYYGYQKDFYEYRFIVDADPDDLAGFYGADAFMELFCVLPFMGTLMMRGGYFDDLGTCHTTGFPAGEMLVSMVFSDDDDEEGKTKWFNKRERFKNVVMNKYVLWDMVSNFGFEKMDDGRLMVYHHGEYFNSRFPPFSLLVRLIFGVHARWVAWATEHHLNHYAFAEGDLQEEWEEESRMDMPLFLLKNYAWLDLMGALFGRKLEQPSFMLKQAQESLQAEDEEEEAFVPAALKVEIPVKRANIRRHITIDIDLDRRESLRRHTLRKEAGIVEVETVETRRRDSLAKEPLPKLQRHGSVAWQVLKSTNNPEAYKAVTDAARERQLARRLSRRLTRRATIEKVKFEKSVKGEQTQSKVEEKEEAHPTSHVEKLVPRNLVETSAAEHQLAQRAVQQEPSTESVNSGAIPAQETVTETKKELDTDPSIPTTLFVKKLSTETKPVEQTKPPSAANSEGFTESTIEEAKALAMELSRWNTTRKKVVEQAVRDLAGDGPAEPKSGWRN